MDGRELLPAEIVEALDRGAMVVTGNQRAARAPRRGFDQRNREQNLASWTPAAVMNWDAWMTSLWHRLLVEGHDTQMLLNHTQEHAVWRTILEADEELASLRTVDSLAEMASEAWQLLCSYNGQQRLRGALGSSDTRAFQRWARTFERLCQTEGFVTQAQLEEALCDLLERTPEKAASLDLADAGIMLMGFDRMTPAQKRLVEALQSTGRNIEQLQFADHSKNRVLVEAAEEQEELSIAARWARTFLEENPTANIAIIVPGLASEKREIDRVFREILAPELEDIRAANETGPYEFSLGIALVETPMVAVAFDLLRWATQPLPLERVSHLLLSPHFAKSDKERGTRAEFDAFELRRARMLRPEITLDQLIAVVERSKRKKELPRLLAAMRATQTVINRLQGLDARTNAEWAEKMRVLLGAASWGAEETETSVEFQTRNKWESALDELSTLDFDGVEIEFPQALSSLERIARQTMFAPESRDAPVQIVGPLEAAGSRFDAVWFLRAGELSWPMETASNSLLPWYLQRELAMPGTDIALDSEHAQKMTERIAACAGTVIFSYASESGEGRQRPSPVLANLGLKEMTTSEIVSTQPERTPIALEEIEDTARVQTLPDRVIRGGARILELQAACGFRAFAEQRLWATELESIAPGMDARESGTVVHRVLQIFWDEVKTQDALRSMTPAEREEALEWCISEGLKKTEEARATTWDAAYIEVQRQRLRRLLSGWLDLELERALPFEVKLSEKEFKDVHVGPLRLSIRMDRVDLVEGGEVLIDYKTGSASPNDWLTARPDAPQLPLYATLSEANQLQGIAFGLVRAGEGRGLKGYAASDGVLPRPTKLKEAATLEAQVDQWRQVLVGLAEEFYSGDARVRPKTYPGTCSRCGQRLLCRLNVSLLEEDDEEGSVTEVSRG
jgi:ATP-dependent helicase/nuclease subunit B